MQSHRSKTRPEMHVVLSDQHIPHQDPIVEDLSIQFVKEHRPAVIHLLGDIMDFYPLSRFDKDPARIDDLQSDIDATIRYFQRLRSVAPRAQIIYSEGNHEARLRKYLWSNAKELAGLSSMKFEKLTCLEEFKIKWVDSMHPYMVGKLLFIHGDLVRRWSAASAKGHYDKYGCCVIHGHTHRQGSFYHTTMGGTYGAWENGCLCSLKPEYCISPDWQNGWSTVWFADRGFFHVEQVCVVKGQYVYHGRLKQHRRRSRH